jgi:putative mRNA 3-end processing factor
VRWLCEQGLDAQAFVTEYGEESAEAETGLAADAEPPAPVAELPPETEGSEQMTMAKVTV